MKRVVAGALGALAIGIAAPAMAASPCGAAYGNPVTTDPAALLAGNGGPAVSHVWGRADVAPVAGGVLRVTYPRGSVDPGNADAPVGGAGFAYRAPGHADARCLAYRVRFQAGFDFAKGGKLPGLYGGEAPRGCIAAELSAGFSARLMWRSGGAGELYLYAPGRAVRCGESIGRGAFRFTPGQWTELAQEVVANTPGQENGAIRIWADGRLVIERTGLTLREQPRIGVDGLLFATFFGGNDASWASPRDQYAEFGGFTIWTGGVGP